MKVTGHGWWIWTRRAELLDDSFIRSDYGKLYPIIISILQCVDSAIGHGYISYIICRGVSEQNAKWKTVTATTIFDTHDQVYIHMHENRYLAYHRA